MEIYYNEVKRWRSYPNTFYNGGFTTYRVTWKKFGGKIGGGSWHGKAGNGKWYRKKLHRAERQLAKRIIAEQLEEYPRLRMKGYIRWFSEVDWKGW